MGMAKISIRPNKRTAVIPERTREGSGQDYRTPDPSRVRLRMTLVVPHPRLVTSAAHAEVPTPTTIPDTRMKSPEEEAFRRLVFSGWVITWSWVASEPDFDFRRCFALGTATGRMYVAEMAVVHARPSTAARRTQISAGFRGGESTRGGLEIIDKHTTFVDNMMLPRASCCRWMIGFLCASRIRRIFGTYRDTKKQRPLPMK